jgi:lipopolysaccharide export system protein LptA
VIVKFKFAKVFIFIIFFVGIAGNLSLFSQKVRDIAYSADFTGFDKKIGADVKRLIGNVVFQDSTATMYCDSAYFYNNHDIDAYGNVRIYPDQGNTKLTGKVLHYKAETRMADIKEDVVLIDEKSTLRTKSIFYDMNTSMGYYPNKGVITSESNTIVSKSGIYNKNLRTFLFKDSVTVTNPSYLIETDTMNYITYSKVVEFQGPTLITSKDDSIYCEKGWYDTKTDISSFRKNAWLKGDGRIVKGDTLYYEKNTGFGKGYGNVELWDTTQNIIIKGNYATINRPTQTAVVTKRALLIQVDNKDSLLMHADTIRTGIFVEKRKNSSLTDTFKFARAYYHVKFFRSDLQGMCDSMHYSFKDSTMEFIGTPVLWTEKTQLTANYIKAYIKNRRIDKMDMNSLAFIISQVDSAHFDQIKGRNMTAFFLNNELYKMIVKGNGQSIYFPVEDGEIQGTDKNESSDIVIFFKNRTLNRITYITSVNGVMYPPDELSGADLLLKDFKWHSDKRPLKWTDIFKW